MSRETPTHTNYEPTTFFFSPATRSMNGELFEMVSFVPPRRRAHSACLAHTKLG